jgi:amino acid adenylation domain-containing protein
MNSRRYHADYTPMIGTNETSQLAHTRSFDYEAPMDDVENGIARIWQELLRRERITLNDNFFELGGHSLLAAQLVSRLRQQFGVDVALREVFAQPTLQGVAQTVVRANRSVQPALLPVNRAGPLPLSWAQQRLWFQDQFDHAASAAYHLPGGLHLRGTLDRGVLKAALDAIVARHEALRTSFVLLDGQPVQQIAPADVGFHLVEHDLSDLAAAERESRVNELSQGEAADPFDLSTGPLIRGRLLRLGAEHHVLLLTQHHIISDGWSSAVLVRELATLYVALRQGHPNPLIPLSIQYADYAVWQRQWLREEVLRAQVGFWRSHLERAPALLELPTDRPRPAVQGYAGGNVPVDLPPELSARVRILSQRHGVTLFMTLLAGWSVLLSRLSGQVDVVIGTPVANRERNETESLIGFFVNTLALRVRLDDDPSVTELLAQIKTNTLEAYAHQDIPFAQLVDALQPPRTLSHSPIFQVMLVLNNAPGERALSPPGLQLSAFEPSQSSAMFDLTLSLRDAGDRIGGKLEYASDLFDRASIERMAGQLLTLLESMVADDRQHVSCLNVLLPPERRQLLEGFNETQAPYPSDRCIHELIEQQAALTPDAVALMFEDQQLTYGALNARANQVARHLVASGIEPDDRVGICLERSLEMVVGLLGVLKAGGAYVPLDPSFPAQRLAYMLDDSAPAVLLTQAAARKHLPPVEVPVVVLDQQDTAALIAREGTHNLDSSELGLSSRNLAYVIYTSGSAGMPKGVMIEHRSVVNLLSAMVRATEISAHDVFLAVTTLSFDIAGLELYLPLLSGARLVLSTRTGAVDAEALSRSLEKHDITFMQATPATWRLLLNHGWPGRHQLRALCGGEALPSDLSARLEAQVATLWNLYGPTETTIWSTMAQIVGSHTAAIASIGRPIDNTQIYILDPRGEPVPIGAVGEIHVGGVGVARGYMSRPELTAQQFVADPFSAVQPARMYRTGDLGRWLQDGSIEYVGRNDFQVKVRGIRIEPGEIEARLMACPGVQEAVVVAFEDSAADKRLAGYLIPRAGAELLASELRRQLTAVLPEYMIPSTFVTLKTFPLSPNGKLDRRALPAPDQGSVANREYETPVGPMETTIVQIWQKLLDLPRIGRHDNFFALGGHSLLVVRLVEAIKAEFGRTIAMTLVFRAPTPAQLAAVMRGTPAHQTWKHLVALNEGGYRSPLLCLNGFDGGVDSYQHIARFIDPSVPVYGLVVGAGSGDDTFHDTFESRIESYLQEILSIQPAGPYRLCGYSFGGAEAFDLGCRLEEAGHEVVLILLDAYRPSRWQELLGWLPSKVMTIKVLAQRHQLRLAVREKIRRIFTDPRHLSLSAKDEDLERALIRNAIERKHTAFRGRVVLFKSTVIDPWVLQLHPDGRNGWRRHVKGRFDVIRMPAMHHELVKEPVVRSVVGYINRILCD